MEKAGHVGKKLRTYNFNRLLGKGAFASVYEVYDEKTGKTCACKVIAKKMMVETPKLKELVQTEITVLKRCRSENVIGYIDSFSTEKEVFILTEFCNGGDMEAYLAKKKRLTEDQAREFLKQILNGFAGLHEIGAMHRDFKTANILLHNGVAKIADLGFSKIMKDTKITNTILGTSVTMAPELLENKPYGIKCDVWSVGVVYYQFLIGEYPYNAYNDHEILKKIKSYPPRFPETIEISEASKEFIRRCLTIDPNKRISWAEIYDHPLLDEKKNVQRNVNIGALMSKIDIKKNKNIYDKKGTNEENKAINNLEDFKAVELGESDRLDLIQEEINKRNVIEKTITNYAELFLQRRNIIMLTIKYGISLIFEMQNLAFDQNLYAFLISKRAFLEIRDLRSNLREKRNLFNLKAYLQEFYNSDQYSEILKQVNNDYDFISIYAASFMSEVRSKNPQVTKHLSLDTFSSDFNALYKEELTAYTFLLYDHKDSPKIKKTVLLRLLTFVSDLVKGIMVSCEEYERKMESLDVTQMEANFAKKIQELFKAYDTK